MLDWINDLYMLLSTFYIKWENFMDNSPKPTKFSSGGVNVVESERKKEKVLRVIMDRLYDN